MTILDKLIEKKNLVNYCRFRIERLRENREELVEEVRPKKRQLAINKVNGRIKELEDIIEKCESGKPFIFREKSKEYYDKCYYGETE